jgi:hypothetical protein
MCYSGILLQDLRKTMENRVGMAGEIRTKHLPSGRPHTCVYINKLGVVMLIIKAF